MMRDDTREWLEEVSQPDYLDRLRTGLKARGITQAEFARQCGCSPSRISALLNRRYAEVCPKYIWERARFLVEPRR